MKDDCEFTVEQVMFRLSETDHMTAERSMNAKQTVNLGLRFQVFENFFFGCQNMKRN